MPNNPNFMCYNKQFLLSKSSPEKVYFDVLVLSVRNIKKAIIPNFIEVIKDYAFAGCMDLESVEFQPDSKLRQIEKNAFNFDSFSFNESLKEIDFMTNSELRVIRNNALNSTDIEKLTIPKSVTHICDRAFFNCESLRYVEFPIDSELQIIEREAFSNSSIKCFVFPPHVTQIGIDIFKSCTNLQIIEIDDNFEMQLIDMTSLTDNENTIIMVPTNYNGVLRD